MLRTLPSILALFLTLLGGVSATAQELAIDQMATDYARPYIYALDRGDGTSDGLLHFINTDSGEIEKTLSIGPDPTHMTVHHGEGKLYIGNNHDRIRIVDLATQEELAPFALFARELYAGRPGRLYYENAGSTNLHILSNTG